MKCFLFLLTLCSLGSFFSQGQDEPTGSSSSHEEGRQSAVEGSAEIIVTDDQPQPDEPSDSSPDDQPQPDEPSEEDQGEQSQKSPNRGSNNKDKDSIEKRKADYEQAKKLFGVEMLAGDIADLIGQNEHMRQSSSYEHLGRRSVPQTLKNTAAENENYLIPEEAPPELVMLVAKESALLGVGKDDIENDINQKKILRSGDYWNGVWKEEVKPKSVLRSGPEKKTLGSIKTKIKQGTELYNVVSQMKEISPKLLYIINKKQL
ncbi:hypothetical protein PYW07_010830 [Mythimna separata]|uniref:Uncharacterized protein n=1 Tax=Mythimna separata TaxID=271217 RepID=A0AAD8DL82_MYTSE|nr:hypothetical protein PYW07_010830 [Mythimna separata]